MPQAKDINNLINQLNESLDNNKSNKYLNWRLIEEIAKELKMQGKQTDMKDALKPLQDIVDKFEVSNYIYGTTAVRISALEAIVVIQEDETALLQQLIQWLTNNSVSQVRQKAANELKKLGSKAKEAIFILQYQALAEVKECDVQCTALEAVAEIENKDPLSTAISLLGKLLKSKNAEMRHCAFKALNSIQKQTAMGANLEEQDAIVKSLNDTIDSSNISENYLMLLDQSESEEKWNYNYKLRVINELGNGKLGELKNKALSKLEELVKSNISIIAQNALETIIKLNQGRTEIPSLIIYLIKFLKNENWLIRQRAAQEFEILGSKEELKNEIKDNTLIELYKRYFNEHDKDVQRSILKAIVTIREDYLTDDNFISIFQEYLMNNNDKNEIAPDFLEKLGKLSENSIKKGIIDSFKNTMGNMSNDYFCSSILVVIRKHDHEYFQNYFKSSNSNLINNLKLNLSDKEWKIRQKSAQQLGKLGLVAQTAVSKLKELILDDDDDDVRDSALEALSNISEDQKLKEELVPFLINNLADGGWKIRQKSAQQLGKLGLVAQSAVSKLKELILKDDDDDVRDSALEALFNISEDQKLKEELVPFLINNLADGEWKIRQKSAQQLGKLGLVAQTVPFLINNLADEEWKIRQKSAQQLGKLGLVAQSAVSKLKELILKEDDDDVRDSALEALFNISEDQKLKEELVLFLIRNLENEDLKIRQKSAQQLGKLGLAVQQEFSASALRNIFLETKEDIKILKDILYTIIHIYKNDKSKLATQLTALLCFKDWQYKSNNFEVNKLEIVEEWLNTHTDNWRRYELSELLEKDKLEERDDVLKITLIQEILKCGLILKNESVFKPFFKNLFIVLSDPTTNAKNSSSDFISNPIQISAINAIKSLGIEIDIKKIFDEYINLLKKSDKNKESFILNSNFIKDLNEHFPNSFELNKNLIEEFWAFINIFSDQTKDKIHTCDWQAFETIYGLMESSKKHEIVEKLIKDTKIPEVKRYCFILRRDEDEKLRDGLNDQWNSANEEDKEKICWLVLNAFKDIQTETKIYGSNRSVSLEASKWIREKIEDIPAKFHEDIRKIAENNNNNYKLELEENLREKTAELLKALGQQEEIESKREKEILRELLNIKDKTLADFDKLVAVIKKTTNPKQEKETKENISVLVEEWIKWILLDRKPLSQLAVQKAADLMRPNAYAILPLINKFKQFNQEWQPEEELRDKILNKIFNNNSVIQNFHEVNFKGKEKTNDDISDEKIDDWIEQVKNRSLNWSNEIKNLNDKKISKNRMVKHLITLLEKEEVDKLKLSVCQKIVQQVAEMSDERFFSQEKLEDSGENQEKKELEYNKQELLKHGVIVLGRHLPNEENDDIRENIARILGNVGGPFAVDALAQAVVGEERKRKERQNLLAQYYLEPSKTRSEEAAQMLKGAIEEAKITLRIHQILNSLIVGVGVTFLTVGLILIISGNDNYKRFTGVLSAAGGASAIALHFFTKPLERIEKAMANLVQGQTAFTSFIWGLNLNGTYIQSQYVSEGTLTDEGVTQTIDRIENTMKVTMGLVAMHLEGGEQYYSPRIHRLVPSSDDFEPMITIYGQNLKGDPQKKKHTCLVAINHTPIHSIEQGKDWSEDQITFKLSKLETQGIVWLSLFVDGLETNVLPFYTK